MHIHVRALDRTAASFSMLSPLVFVERSAAVFGDLPAVIHGARLAAALRALGVGRLDTVTVMPPNTPEMVAAHCAAAAINAFLDTLNTRLDAPLLAWQMAHCAAKVVLTDSEFAPVMAQALRILKAEHGREPVVVDVCCSEHTGPGERIGSHAYEAPPAALIEGMAAIGCDITHVYGLTEVYGPASVAVKRPSWAGEGGWFHTGDLAVLEPDRHVKIKDRSKDIIISGGENKALLRRPRPQGDARRTRVGLL